MNLLCLCPTYGRSKSLIESTIALFCNQDHPANERRLLLFDDGGNVDTQASEIDGWAMMSYAKRMPTLPGKYNEMLVTADRWWPDWDAIIVWDDDDIYLSHHLSSHAEALTNGFHWSHPLEVYSTFGVEIGQMPRREGAAGRFHGSLALGREPIRRLAGWIQTGRADFDQQQIAACQDLYDDPGRPDKVKKPSYVFRWADTGEGHCQGLMLSVKDETWYARNERPLHPIRQLEPRLQESAELTMAAIKAQS